MRTVELSIESRVERCIAFAGHCECVELLLAAGADPNIPDKDFMSPLHLAKSKEIAERLLTSRADPSALDGLSRTPFMAHKANR